MAPATYNTTASIRFAEAFGLGLDAKLYRKGRAADRFGPVVFWNIRHPLGFVTKVRDDLLRRTDKGITIISDGDIVFIDDKWQPYGNRVDSHESHLDFIKKFTIVAGTFAAVDVDGIAERIFIYNGGPVLNYSDIERRLKNFRAEHPPNLFPLGQKFPNPYSP